MRQGSLQTHSDYITLVSEVIQRFREAVANDLRMQARSRIARTVWGVVWNEQRGAMDPERCAKGLAQHFYEPFWDGGRTPIQMDDLPFVPADHVTSAFADEDFHPTRHNWLREHKVPVLIINATTVNTGHGWQFTPHWMGEAPWSNGHEVDSVPRLEWAYYDSSSDWRIELARAVAASACVRCDRVRHRPEAESSRSGAGFSSLKNWIARVAKEVPRETGFDRTRRRNSRHKVHRPPSPLLAGYFQAADKPVVTIHVEQVHPLKMAQVVGNRAFVQPRGDDENRARRHFLGNV